MPASYYVSTDDGRVHHISDVTTTPTIVVNDGVASVVYDGYYRNVFPYANTGASTASSYPYGPGWTGIPTYTGSPPAISAYNIQPDDVAGDVPPRPLEIKKSYWKFVTAGGSYFFPIERVVGMSNNPPSY